MLVWQIGYASVCKTDVSGFDSRRQLQFNGAFL